MQLIHCTHTRDFHWREMVYPGRVGRNPVHAVKLLHLHLRDVFYCLSFLLPGSLGFLFCLAYISILSLFPGQRFLLLYDPRNYGIKTSGILLIPLSPGLPSVTTNPCIFWVSALKECTMKPIRKFAGGLALTRSQSCWYKRFPVLPPVSLYGIFAAIQLHRCCSSCSVNCVRLAKRFVGHEIESELLEIRTLHLACVLLDFCRPAGCKQVTLSRYIS